MLFRSGKILIIRDKKSARLTKEGEIFLEIGYDQGEAVCALLMKEGYKNVEVSKDLAGLDRVVKADFY